MRRVLTVILVSLLPAAARADTIEACAAAAEAGQKLQREGRLVESRASFVACADARCPREVASLCDRLLTEVDSALPTVILGARDPQGRDLAAVRVLADGTTLADSLDGKPRPLDPGPHTLRFVASDGAAASLDVVVRQGEKNRVLSVVVGAGRKQPPPTEGEARAARHAPVLGWVLGGVGLAALATFGVLAVHGQSQYDACSPHKCSPSTVDSLSLERGAAFVALGVGVAGVATGGWLVLSGTF
ncbi:MAG TPA: hypothetical protein VF765_04140 [Polyangiaceae bacterium]